MSEAAMSVPGAEPGPAVVIQVGETLDGVSAEAIRPALMEALDGSGAAIDMSAVRRISTTGMQFLMSALETASMRDVPVHITSPSAGFVRALETLGLTPFFAKWIRL
ncbi:MAG: STAS domain-containing protein [Pseudomonadota bacterium]